MTNQHENHTLPPKKGSIDQLITIPKDIEKVIKGEKTATRRNGRYADIGEVMTLEGHKFVVEKVYQQALGDLTDEDARKEGYKSLEDYKEKILSIHPGMRWMPKLEVWVHEFSPLQS
jgi:N4-acetylcytidine amidohydrolase